MVLIFDDGAEDGDDFSGDGMRATFFGSPAGEQAR
jgi:hypothetical protein